MSKDPQSPYVTLFSKSQPLCTSISHSAWLMHQNVEVSENQLNEDLFLHPHASEQIASKDCPRGNAKSGKQRIPETVASRLNTSICLKCQYLLSEACGGLQIGTEDQRCLYILQISGIQDSFIQNKIKPWGLGES